jgi:hypothetical protein
MGLPVETVARHAFEDAARDWRFTIEFGDERLSGWQHDSLRGL